MVNIFKGKLYLLPTPIDEHGLEKIPAEATRIMHSLEHFIVEKARTSRSISSTKPPINWTSDWKSGRWLAGWGLYHEDLMEVEM